MLLRLASTAALLLLLPLVARADAPPIIPVQGFLTDESGVPEDGPHRLTFFLYDDATGGELLYTDDLSSVDIDSGHFIVYLGAREDNELDLALFQDHPDVWIEIVLDGSETISPRVQLGSVAYAAHAQSCVDAAHAAEADSAAEADHATTADSATSAADSAKLGGQLPSAFASSTHTHTVTGCVTVDGPCGNGTYGQPTLYLDRVGMDCPAATPLMRGWRFARCGVLDTGDEGLLIRATCCAIAAP